MQPYAGRRAHPVAALTQSDPPPQVQAPDPCGRRISAGAGYQFGIDHGRLSTDPYSGKGTGSWVYAPGTPEAVWR